MTYILNIKNGNVFLSLLKQHIGNLKTFSVFTYKTFAHFNSVTLECALLCLKFFNSAKEKYVGNEMKHYFHTAA